MTRVLVVFDHPRRDSFCGAVLNRFVDGLQEAGHVPAMVDLHRERFDPRMPVADEPDWSDDEKRYSDAVLAEQARVEGNDAIAFVFPVWWWSLPAMTKGWIDRVWNNGWAYGGREIPLRKALMVGVNAGEDAGYAKRGYDVAMRTQLVTGIMNYCGITDAALEFFHGSLDSAETRTLLLERAFHLGRNF